MFRLRNIPDEFFFFPLFGLLRISTEKVTEEIGSGSLTHHHSVYCFSSRKFPTSVTYQEVNEPRQHVRCKPYFSTWPWVWLSTIQVV